MIVTADFQGHSNGRRREQNEPLPGKLSNQNDEAR